MSRRDFDNQCFGRSPFGGIFWGLIIVLIGAIFLLEDQIPWLSFENFWPMIIILIGLFIILNALTKK
jgi:uncharacterized membrane protein